jgi:hypothetical protein
MVAPKSIGNLSDLNFSVLHDHYPGITTSGISPFYQDGNWNNHDNVLKSQLAISYLLAKRDGIPLIIRYEEEKDNISGIIARSIDFRSKMKIKDAPHEYIKALNDDVLLVARQFGFAVINKGNTDYKVPQSDIRSNPHLSFYIPNGTYKDKSGNSYNVPNLDLTVNGKNAAFLILDNSTGQKSADHIFSTKRETLLGQRIFVAGNHPVLGNWSCRADGLNGLLNKQSHTPDGSIYPIWKSLTLRFPMGISLEYKYVKASESGEIITWDSGDNQVAIVNSSPDSSSSPVTTTATNTDISFSVQKASTFLGQNLYVIGNIPELGNWNPNSGVLMSCTGTYPNWIKSISLPRSQSIQYK